ncbi:Ubiquitin domain containing protein [Balamuthia mandrillaris]
MKVFRADTGEVHDLPDLPSSTLISTIKQHLAILSAIDPQDQILLCGKLKLEDSRSLDYYRLPAEERPVFLFSRQALQPGALPPKQTVLGPIEVKLPGESPLPRLAGALVKYEHQFSHHLSFAKGVLVAVDGRIALSRRCYAEQDIQAKALEAATANLNDHNGQILQAFSTFKEHFIAQQSKHYGLLESFAHDLQRLRETVIHEALQTPTMRTLIDCIPEDRLRKWADDCRKEHEQLALRISELEAGIVRANEEVEAENLKPPDVDFEDLRERINLAVKQRKEAGAIKTAFAQDVKKVREALKTEQENNERGYHGDDSRHGGARSWEDYVPFDQAQKGHVKMLDRLTKIDSSVRSIMNACADSKTRLSQCVHMRLQRISVLQSNIRDVANKVIVFREALSRQKQAFAQLVYVKYLPEAYAASMEEVGRRKVFADILQEAFNRFRSALKKLEEQEIRERQLFLSKFGRYIPKNLVPGLTEPLPPFDKGIKYIPFDRSLPVLDAAQVSSSAVAFVYENLPPLFRHLLQPPDKDYPLPDATDKSQQLALRELEEENERLRQQVTKLQKLEEEEQASSTSHAGERVKLLEQSEAAYKQRILALEEKLSRTYRQVSQLQMQLSAASSQNLSSNSLPYAAQSDLLSFNDSERKQLLRRLEEEQEEREQQLNQKKNEQQQLVQQLEEQLHRALAEKAEAIAAKEAQSASLEAALARVDAEKRKTQKLVQQIKAKKAAEKHKILQVLSQYEEGKRKVADGSDGREKGEGLSASGSGKMKPFRSTSTPALASLPVSLTSTSTPPSFAYSSSSSSSIRGRKTSLALMSPIDEIEETETTDTEQQKQLNVEDFEENEEEMEGDESISLSASTSSSASFFQPHKTRKHLRKHSAPATPSSSSSSKATSQAEMLLNSAHQERQLHNTQQELLRAVEKLKEAENKIHELKGTINVLNITNAEYMSTRKELEEQVVALQQQVIALADNQSHKIAYQDFKVDDLALFLPNDLGHYEAFNRNAPNYMLSEESLSMFPDERRKRAAVLGQIIEIVEQVAARRQNPYHKDMGTKFYEVTITQV